MGKIYIIFFLKNLFKEIFGEDNFFLNMINIKLFFIYIFFLCLEI